MRPGAQGAGGRGGHNKMKQPDHRVTEGQLKEAKEYFAKYYKTYI